MFKTQKNGAELADKLTELREIERSEAYRTAVQMRRASEVLDSRIYEARKMEREGRQLLADGISMDAINEILRKMGSEAD